MKNHFNVTFKVCKLSKE